MSHRKSHVKTKAAAVAGAAVVALSGFVPQPLISSAHAASAKISVTGSFITGVKLGAGVNAQFGSNAATAPNGKATISTAGVLAVSKAAKVGGAPQAGSFAFTAVSTTPNVNFTVAGLGPLTLAATGGGAGPVGTMKLKSIILGGVGAAATTLTSGGGTTAKKAGYDITTKTGPIKVGAVLTWGGTQPLGAFTQQITLTAAY